MSNTSMTRHATDTQRTRLNMNLIFHYICCYSDMLGMHNTCEGRDRDKLGDHNVIFKKLGKGQNYHECLVHTCLMICIVYLRT